MKVVKLLAFPGLLVVILTGCATPNYSGALGTFADATANAEKSLSQLNDSLAEIYAEEIRTQIMDRQRTPITASGECANTSRRCRLQAKSGADGSVLPLSYENPLKNSLATAKGIKNYAAGLKAIAESDTGAKVTESINKTLGAVESLALNLGLPSQSITQFKPVTDLLTWAIKNVLERRKIAGLKSAITQANPVIVEAGTIYSDLASVGREPYIQKLVQEFRAAEDNFFDNPNAINLTALEASASTLDNFLLASADGVYTSMADAHAKLLNHFNGGNTSLVSVIATINSFADKSLELAKLTQAIEDAP